MPSSTGRGRSIAASHLAAVAFLLVAFGCFGSGGQRFDPDTSPRSALPEAVAALRFDSTPPAADSARFGAGASGPVVRFEPELSAGTHSDGDLREGRFVGRVDARGGPNAMGAPQGISYAWVDSSAAGWRIRLIPADTTAPIVDFDLFRPGITHAQSEPVQARVRVDSFANFRCGRWCCSPFIFGVTPERLTDLFSTPGGQSKR